MRRSYHPRLGVYPGGGRHGAGVEAQDRLSVPVDLPAYQVGGGRAVPLSLFPAVPGHAIRWRNPMTRRDRTLNPALLATWVVALTTVLLLGAPAPAGAQSDVEPIPEPDPCLAIADPLPSGVTDRPPHNFTTFPDLMQFAQTRIRRFCPSSSRMALSG